MFWWEEGYVRPDDPNHAKEKRGVYRPSDGIGKTFLTNILETEIHHLHVQFCPNLKQLITLDNCTRSDTRLRTRCSNTGEILKEFSVDHNSGFISISPDNKMIAIAVLKKDIVMLYELSSGDLLINLEGGQKQAFWGKIIWLPSNNDIIELRSVKIEQGESKANILRLWNLGFNNKSKNNIFLNSWFNDDLSLSNQLEKSCAINDNNDNEGDDSDDEIEEKLWEIDLWSGKIQVANDDNNIFITGDEEKKLSIHNILNGNCIKTVDKETEWNSKCIFSSDHSMFASAYFGKCFIRDSISLEIIGEVNSIPNDPFPMVPIAFINDNRWLLLRVNQDRTVILCDWKYSSNQYVLKECGGTISDDSCIISPDEKQLVCFPYGELEFFDLKSMKNQFLLKINKHVRYSLYKLKKLYHDKRAILSNSMNITKYEQQIIDNDKDIDNKKKKKSSKTITKETKNTIIIIKGDSAIPLSSNLLFLQHTLFLLFKFIDDNNLFVNILSYI